ncbi:MAG: hypothetical protein HQK88_07750 [Nitrospirae bacterium]|nr:hypothetical protein [Nitrospirota bacterium]MBF0533652.1 hypothetical protein [Nitrospirota bacterium]MBF0616697.1 hypothetical protein [Nitrospirota bacterium]
MKYEGVFYPTAKALLVLAVVWISFRTINFYTTIALVNDSAIFANIAFHMFKGKVLYKAAYDHKLPPIFFLNLLALKLAGPSVNSIYAMERIFAIAMAITFFSILLKFFRGSFPVALIFTLVFLRHFYTPLLFSSGNYTEEYGSAFLLIGILALLYCIDSGGYKQIALLAASGFFMSLAALTKEPFVFLVIPWVIYLFLKLDLVFKVKMRLGIIFMLALLLPALIIIVYFMREGLFQYLLEVISNNLAYSHYNSYEKTGIESALSGSVRSMNKNILFIITTDVFFVVGATGAFSKRFNREYSHIPMLLLIWFIMGTVSVNLASTQFSHYYLQLIAPFTAVAAAGAVFLADALKRYFNFTARLSFFAVIAAFTLSLFIFDSAMTYQFYERITKPYEKRQEDVCSYYIKNNTTSTDYIWVPSYNKYTYIESGRLSPTSYIYVLNHLFINTFKSKGTEKAENLLKELRENPPKFIVSGDIQYLNEQVPAAVTRWIFDNYTLKITLHRCLILQKNY